MTIVSLNYPFSTQKYCWNGIHVIPLGGKNNWYIRKFQLKSSLISVLNKINQELQIDVLHSFWLNEATGFTSKFSKKNGVPHIATTMGQDILPSNKWLKKLNFEAFRLVTLSGFQTKNLLNQGIHSHFQIPWGISENQTQNKSIDIIGVGNLIPLKNFSYFVDIVTEACITRPDLKVVLIGDGPLKVALQQKVSEKGLSNTISFLGEQNYEQTQSLISQSKMLLHPANFEGFGMIFIEAKSSQTHVLSQKVGFMFDQEIDFLTLDKSKDAEMVLETLSAELPQKEIISISDTVNQYLKIYYDL